MAIFPKGLTNGLCQKKAIFPTFFSLGNIGQENVFYDILKQKNAFLGYRNKNFEKLKNWHFFKWDNPWILCKNVHFSNFSGSYNIGQENVFYDNLERKNAFLGYKNKKFKQSKNWHFSRGVNPWFCSKNCDFSIFFWQYRPGNCLLRYSRTKKRLSML